MGYLVIGIRLSSQDLLYLLHTARSKEVRDEQAKRLVYGSDLLIGAGGAGSYLGFS